MARGNEIVVTANPRGVFTEGYVKTGQTFKPGMIVQVDPSVALQGARHTFKIYSRVADGDRPAGAYWVVVNDPLVGQLPTGSFAAGDRVVYLYSPIAGEELNVLLADVAGTADAHALGEVLMPQNNTGKMIATAGTPQRAPFILLEAVAAPTADTLAWVQFGG